MRCGLAFRSGIGARGRLSPRWGFFTFRPFPMACAMGCILSPLRGWKAAEPRTSWRGAKEMLAIACVELSKSGYYLVDNVL